MTGQDGHRHGAVRHDRHKHRELVRLAFLTLGRERLQKLKASLAKGMPKSHKIQSLKQHVREALDKIKSLSRPKENPYIISLKEEDISELSTKRESGRSARSESLSDYLSERNIDPHTLELDEVFDTESDEVEHMLASFGPADGEVDEEGVTYEEAYIEEMKLEEQAHLRARVPRLATYDEIPLWMKDNEYIKTGYRLHYEVHHTLKSFAEAHNESMNIWTHFGGVLMIVGLAIYSYGWYLETRTLEDKLLFGCFFAGAALCLGFSATFHWWLHLNEHANKTLAKLDYAGISTLIMGSQYPIIFYLFSCWTTLRMIYSAAVLSLGVAVLLVSLINYFAQPRFRWLRAAVFLLFGLSSVVPISHAVILVGFEGAVESGFWYLMALALFYVVGTLIYAMRLPERFAPGKFDIVGHAHQIFHVFVVGGTVSTYLGLQMIMTVWRERTVSGYCDQFINSTIV